MLLLSKVIGRDVCGPDGQVVGRLADLTVSLGRHPGRHRVERLLVKSRRGGSLLVPWDQVAGFDRSRVVLIAARGDRYPAAALTEHEILLARDVLDTQVVDVVGQRMTRVADVMLARTRVGGLELVGVEVGFGAVLRRLGLGMLAAGRGKDVIDWAEVHLTSERGHAVQLASPRAAVHRLDPRALAALVAHLDTDAATEILAAKSPAVAAEAVRAAHPSVAERVLRAMPATAAARIVAAMPADHAGRWRRRLEHAPALRGRRFLRSRVWPRRRHVGHVP